MRGTVGAILGFVVFLIAGTARATPLTDAIDQGDEAAVDALVAKGADVNEKAQGYPPLAFAIGKTAIAQVLIKHGADVNAPFSLGDTDEIFDALGMKPTPFTLAIWMENAEAAGLFMAHGAKPHRNALGLLAAAVNAQSSGGHSDTEAFYAELDAKTLPLAKFLTEHGAALILPGRAPPLWDFAQGLCVATAGQLVKKGANVNARVLDKSGTEVSLLKALRSSYRAQRNQLQSYVDLLGGDDAAMAAAQQRWDVPAVQKRQDAIIALLVARGAKE